MAPSHLAKEVLPLAAAAESTAAELPGYARERLQMKVRQTLGRPAAAKEKSTWTWRWWWWLVLAPEVALVVWLMLPRLNQNETFAIQVAMLDTVGATGGTGTNLLPVLEGMWKGSAAQKFASASDSETWEKNWPSGGKAGTVKIIYDRTTGEVRVLGRWRGVPFQKTFPVGEDPTSAFQQARAFVIEQARR